MDYHKQLKVWAARKQRMIAMRARGLTMDQIAAKMGVTRQRVCVVLNGKKAKA